MFKCWIELKIQNNSEQNLIQNILYNLSKMNLINLCLIFFIFLR